MNHWKKYFNPNYIGAYAFQPGEEKPVTIQAVNYEKHPGPEGGEETDLIVHFKEPEKPLILNKTNAKAIEKLHGSDIDQWPGKGIILCVMKVKAFGELTDAVRIRPVPPFLCADCGGVITGMNGKSHQEIRDITNKKYRRQLCPACATEAAKKLVTGGQPDTINKEKG